MRVKFLVDYIGRETVNQLYFVGDAVDLPHQAAIDLLRLGVAVEDATQNKNDVPKKPRKKADAEVIDESDE